MKLRIARRTAHEYESSLSSHPSYDQQPDLLSCTMGTRTHTAGSGIMSGPEYFTPARKPIKQWHDYSLKKPWPHEIREWGEDGRQCEAQAGGWQCESEDSKLRRREDNNNCRQGQQLKYKQHARILKFEDLGATADHDKQNLPLSTSHCESDDSDGEQFTANARGRCRRAVGTVLYARGEREARSIAPLPPIVEEQTRLSCTFTVVN